MAISVLDVRDTALLAAPRPAQVLGGAAAESGTERVLHRAPAAVVAVAALGLLQAVAIVAAALATLGRVLTADLHPSGAVVTLVLLLLAAWVVACAGSGATVLDGTGRRLFTVLATGELAAVAVLLLVSVVVRLPTAFTGGVPVPIAALLAISLPAGKLLLAGSDGATRWVAQGPRPREQRIDPVGAHRALCAGTLAVIGLVLGGVALLGPTSGPAHHGGSSTASVEH